VGISNLPDKESKEIMDRSKIREQAIENTCSNLILGGYIYPKETEHYMKLLNGLSDGEVAMALINSRAALDSHLEDVNLN